MTRNRGFNAITTFEQASNGFEFNPSIGIPLVAYYCNECGYLEAYAAQKTRFWTDLTTAVDPWVGYSHYESAVGNALETLFDPAAIERNFIIRLSRHTAEIDFLVRTPTKIYSIEIRYTPLHHGLDKAARRVADDATLLEHVFRDNRPIVPVIIVPAGHVQEYQADEVKVLQFDVSNMRFTNPEILELPDTQPERQAAAR